MDFSKLSDQEILKIADPLWENIVDGLNEKNHAKVSRDFSKSMLEGVSEEFLDEQWKHNPVLTSLSKEKSFLGCLHRESKVTILWRQLSTRVSGEFLFRLTLTNEGGQIKVSGALID